MPSFCGTVIKQWENILKQHRLPSPHYCLARSPVLEKQSGVLRLLIIYESLGQIISGFMHVLLQPQLHSPILSGEHNIYQNHYNHI